MPGISPHTLSPQRTVTPATLPGRAVFKPLELEKGILNKQSQALGCPAATFPLR